MTETKNGRAKRMHDVLGASVLPRDRGRVTLGKDGDGLAVDDELAILGRDLALELTVGRVVLEHVDHVLEVDCAGLFTYCVDT
jgi:hypothetical protein